MKKSINPQAIAIQRRFFEALDLAISLGKITGLKGFCDDHQLNRTKYSCIKNSLDKPLDETNYKMIDLDALFARTLAFPPNGCCSDVVKCLNRKNNAHPKRNKVFTTQTQAGRNA